MIVYNVWAFDFYYPVGPNDLKGTFFKKEDADALVQVINKKGYKWDCPDFCPDDDTYVTYYDRCFVKEVNIL